MLRFLADRTPLAARLGAVALGLTLSGAVLADAPPAVVEEPAPAPVAAAGPQVSIKTTMGEIVLELDQEKAPKTVANFLQYTKSGYYNGTIFHRVIDGFMIQGGGVDAKFVQRPTRKPIKNESDNGLSNLKYTISMAREDAPDSATSQWFINVADNIGLDHPRMNGSGYAVFGKVVQGQEVVDKIKGVVVDDPKPHLKNVPVVPIVIMSVSVIKKN